MMLLKLKIFLKFGPVTPELAELTYERLVSNISGCTVPIFAIFLPYERALGADDGT